jgi:hypothetical protein
MNEKQFANLAINLWRAYQRAEALRAQIEYTGPHSCQEHVSPGKYKQLVARWNKATERRKVCLEKLQKAIG